MTEEPTDVAALFERLKEEVRAAGPRAGDVTPAQVRLSVRDQAERLWAVSADRPVVGKGGPIKRFLRRLMRWYVEPAFAGITFLGRRTVPWGARRRRGRSSRVRSARCGRERRRRC